jgi:glycosyltransferase involved in cell wall biosynthesis
VKRILLIVDPIDGTTSVQFEIVQALVRNLRPQYRVAIFSPYCNAERAAALAAEGCELFVEQRMRFPGNWLLERFSNTNESMLWAESWLREAFFGRNEDLARRTLAGQHFDHTINLSMTTAYPSDLWWIQGTPLDLTISGMADSNLIARLADLLGRPLLADLDATVMGRLRDSSRQIVANSPYLREFHRARGIPVEGVVYSLKDFCDFQPSAPEPARDYVLLYIGKETNYLDLRALKDAGVRVVAFGSKLPLATRMRKFTESVDFRGFVTTPELVDLYSNAMFTLFPFSLEPLGYVPIESMACGTPVLTYGRQGPGTTVVDGVTGWFVRTAEEMVSKAAEIWRRGTTGIAPSDCVRRAHDFSAARSTSELIGLIEGIPAR